MHVKVGQLLDVVKEPFVSFTRESVRRFIACFVFCRDNFIVNVVLFGMALELCDLGCSLASFFDDRLNFLPDVSIGLELPWLAVPAVNSMYDLVGHANCKRIVHSNVERYGSHKRQQKACCLCSVGGGKCSLKWVMQV